jgi:hypothetical protein
MIQTCLALYKHYGTYLVQSKHALLFTMFFSQYVLLEISYKDGFMFTSF